MPRLKKQNPKTLKDRISFLEKQLADIQTTMNNLNKLEQTNGAFQPLEEVSQAEKTSLPLESLEQVNGQLEESPLDKVKKLEKVLATAQVNPFGTTDYSIFESSIESKTMASLQDLAQRVGVNPWDSMPVLKKNLKTAFIQTTQGTMKPRPPTKNVTLNPRDPKHLKVMQSLGMKVG